MYVYLLCEESHDSDEERVVRGVFGTAKAALSSLMDDDYWDFNQDDVYEIKEDQTWHIGHKRRPLFTIAKYKVEGFEQQVMIEEVKA